MPGLLQPRKQVRRRSTQQAVEGVSALRHDRASAGVRDRERERFSRTNEFQLLLDEAEHGILKDYDLTHGVLLAADYGVPQRRPRTIVIGSRVGEIPLPEPTHAKVPTAGRKPWRTVRDAIGWVDWYPTTTELPEKHATYFERSIRGEFRGTEIHLRQHGGQCPVDGVTTRVDVGERGQDLETDRTAPHHTHLSATTQVTHACGEQVGGDRHRSLHKPRLG